MKETSLAFADSTVRQKLARNEHVFQRFQWSNNNNNNNNNNNYDDIYGAVIMA